MSKKLETIRKKIDALDDRIHDTLMERAELIVGVAAEKKKSGLPYAHPAREAQMIRRLMNRHKGSLPAAAVVRIWRELVGAVTLMQTGLKISVCFEPGYEILWDMAKAYFGSVVPMQKLSSPLTAIASVRENESSFAVLPWPHDGEEAPWWPHLFSQENTDIEIVCALPYGVPKGRTLSWEDRALIVTKSKFMPSGEDHSFVALELDQDISRGRIVDAMQSLGFEPLSLFTKIRYQGQPMNVHLVELNDYITQGDARLVELQGKFGEQEVRCMALGGYPVPPVFDATVQEKGIVAPPVPGASIRNGRND